MKIPPISELMEVPSTDPDDARRRRLLNIILVGTTLIGFFGAVIIGGLLISGAVSMSDFGLALLILVAGLLGNVGIFFINRYGSGLVASSLLLFFITILFAQSKH